MPKVPDADWNGRSPANREERARRTRMGKADVRRLQEAWFQAACAEYNAERTEENLKELHEAWKVYRGR